MNLQNALKKRRLEIDGFFGNNRNINILLCCSRISFCLKKIIFRHRGYGNHNRTGSAELGS